MATSLTDARPGPSTVQPSPAAQPTAGRRPRHTYGFDDVALVPGNVTVDPADTDVSWQIGPHRLGIPIVASAMDGVADPSFVITLCTAGGARRPQPRAAPGRHLRPARLRRGVRPLLPRGRPVRHARRRRRDAHRWRRRQGAGGLAAPQAEKFRN